MAENTVTKTNENGITRFCNDVAAFVKNAKQQEIDFSKLGNNREMCLSYMAQDLIPDVEGYVIRKAREDSSFEQKLLLPWKSVEGLLKYMTACAFKSIGWNGDMSKPPKAQSVWIEPTDFFGWIEAYYASDIDKEEWEKQQKEAAESKVRAEKMKAEEARVEKYCTDHGLDPKDYSDKEKARQALIIEDRIAKIDSDPDEKEKFLSYCQKQNVEATDDQKEPYVKAKLAEEKAAADARAEARKKKEAKERREEKHRRDLEAVDDIFKNIGREEYYSFLRENGKKDNESSKIAYLKVHKKKEDEKRAAYDQEVKDRATAILKQRGQKDEYSIRYKVEQEIRAADKKAAEEKAEAEAKAKAAADKQKKQSASSSASTASQWDKPDLGDGEQMDLFSMFGNQ